MKVPAFLEPLVRPLRSRKVRVALATVLSAYAASAGWNLSEELVLTILGVGVALILGIAHEDNAVKMAAGSVTAAKVEATAQKTVAETELASTIVAADASVAVAKAENK